MEREKEKAILEILEQDARTTPEQIAAMLGMDAEQVRQAIRQLESAGIIRRYKTVIDWDRFGEEQVFAFIDVKVSPAREVGFDDVAERIYRFPQVHAVYLVSGDHDLRVIVSGRTMKEVAAFVAERLAPLDRVQATYTQFVLKRYKEDGEVYAEAEPDRRLVVTP
ncbi:MAG: Lrp/AsnC family transcriptional regulator [Armatimonadota bacterium]|nr:Lrp/AsnC family transcriptional regulator [Armatimonadota bacterium]MDW8290194.1 Lrp/AsnC family transcriptional regulator [Armatimonadota bacterium]